VQFRPPDAHAPGGRPACPPAALQTMTDDAVKQQTPASNTGPLGGPVITRNNWTWSRDFSEDWDRKVQFFRIKCGM